MSTPKCTDSHTHELWKHVARYVGGVDKRATDFCCDCLPAFQERMLLDGRCERPEIRFRKDKIGFIEGFVPKEKA